MTWLPKTGLVGLGLLLGPVVVNAQVCLQVDGKWSCSTPKAEKPQPQTLPLGSSGSGIDWSGRSNPPTYIAPPSLSLPGPSSGSPTGVAPPLFGGQGPSGGGQRSYNVNPNPEFRPSLNLPPIVIPDIRVDSMAQTLAEIQASVAAVGMARAAFWARSTDAMKALKKKRQEEFENVQKEQRRLLEGVTATLPSSVEGARQSVDAIVAGISGIALERVSTPQRIARTPIEDIDNKGLRDRLRQAADRVAQLSPQMVYQERAEISAVALFAASARLAREGDMATAELLLSLGEVLLDIATGLTPGVGFARDVYEALTGTNAITGQPLTGWEQAVAAVGVATVGAASGAVRAERVLAQLASITQRLLRNKAFISTERYKVVRRAYEIAEEVLKARKMEANVRYEVGGYYYFMDELGRLREVRGELRLERMASDSYQQRLVRDSMGKLGDDAGHVVSSRFGGLAERFNLVPMDAGLNRGAYRELESTWAKALTEGKTVGIQVKPFYDDATFRPLNIEVKYKIDGVPVDLTFRNSKMP